MSSALRVSFGANLVLLGTVAMLLWRNQPAAPSPVDPPAQPAATRPAPPKTEARIQELQPQSSGPKLTPSAIAQLEQMGISRDTLVNVLLEDLNSRSAKRLLELQKKYAPRLVPDHEMRELSRQSATKQMRELKDAFGEEGYLAWDKQQTLRNLNRARLPGDDLPMTAAEAEQAYRLQKEFDENNLELQMAMEDGVADTADGAALQARAQQTLDRELEKLLGKQRLDELRGNTDPATEVYRTFSDLNPTPDQAKAVLLAEEDYRAGEAALARRLNGNQGNAPNIAAELQALNEAQDENLRQIFGADAYDNTKRQNDPTYKTLLQYADVWELEDQEVHSVYQTLHAFDDQANRMRSAAEMSEAAGQRVNWRELNNAIDQARLQTEANLQKLIGNKRLWRLKQNGVLTQ